MLNWVELGKSFITSGPDTGRASLSRGANRKIKKSPPFVELAGKKSMYLNIACKNKPL